MKFRVRVGDDDMPVEFEFATDADLQSLGYWRPTRKLSDNALVQDALEYSRHVTKRWRAYQLLGRTVNSFEILRRTIRQNPTAEVVFLIVARARWHAHSPILGFCFCRRTWCHNIILDFAASHPNAIRKAGGEVRGVGSSMLYSLVKIADNLGVKTVWGEATENSFEFYQGILEVQKVYDHFFICGDIFKHCLRQLRLVVLNDHT